MRGEVVCRISEETRRALLDLMPQLHWRSGKTTALGAAAEVKLCDVAELYGNEAFTSEVGARLLARLLGETVNADGFAHAALPKRVAAMRINRYREGGHYGAHVDEAVNSQGVRADLSFTLLLQAAESGGTLYVGGDRVAMLEGDVYLYPSTTAHGVTTVEQGERIVIVGWVESQVRDHGRRLMLRQVQRMIDNPNERDEVNLRAVRNELLRRWAT